MTMKPLDITKDQRKVVLAEIVLHVLTTHQDDVWRDEILAGLNGYAASHGIAPEFFTPADGG